MPANASASVRSHTCVQIFPESDYADARLQDAWFSEMAIGQAERIPESEGRTGLIRMASGLIRAGFRRLDSAACLRSHRRTVMLTLFMRKDNMLYPTSILPSNPSL